MNIYINEDWGGNPTKTIFSIKIKKKYSKITSENMLFNFNSDHNVGTLKNIYYTFLLMGRVVSKDYKEEFKTEHEFMITDKTVIALLRNEKLHNIGVEKLKYFLSSINEI